MMKIGIFGGSFNPIHYGHIALAQAAREQCRLDEVWLMVSPQNPLKQQAADLLDDHLRLEMAQKALVGVDGVKACDYEFHLPKPSYTWNTLQHLSADYPDYRFTLLIGGDNWVSFRRWYRAADILDNYPIVVYPRRGSNFDDTLLPPGVTIVNTQLLDISSTEIRRRVSQGKSIQGLVPEAIETLVWKYYENFSAKRFAVSDF